MPACSSSQAHECPGTQSRCISEQLQPPAASPAPGPGSRGPAYPAPFHISVFANSRSLGDPQGSHLLCMRKPAPRATVPGGDRSSENTPGHEGGHPLRVECSLAGCRAPRVLGDCGLPSLWRHEPRCRKQNSSPTTSGSLFPSSAKSGFF